MTDHTENEIESLRSQNAALQQGMQELAAAVRDLRAQLAPPPAETATEQAARLKAEQAAQTKVEYPVGSLTAAAVKMATDRPAELAAMFNRRAEGLPDAEPAAASVPVGLTAAAVKLRAAGR